MSHDIADQLRAVLAEVEPQGPIVQDVTDAFRRDKLPRYRKNRGVYNRLQTERNL